MTEKPKEYSPVDRFNTGLEMINSAGFLTRAAAYLAKHCQWSENDQGLWDTACGETFQFDDEGPQENRFGYCPYCAGILIPVKYQRADAQYDHDEPQPPNV